MALLYVIIGNKWRRVPDVHMVLKDWFNTKKRLFR